MEIVQTLNNLLWHDYVLYVVLATGVLFTMWSVFSQYRSLTHGVAVTLGHYDNPRDPGAINHFQALATAMSSTVGLGNIGGVAIAIALGGPGALFWMWVVGVIGMAVKVVEVTLAMMYRNVEDPDNPHGGPMWVAKKAFAELGWVKLGFTVGAIYSVATIIGSTLGGNMFQAWNVADVTNTYFGWPKILVGAILSVTVALVLIGGIKRIGHVTGLLVPVMCFAYMVGGVYVLVLNIDELPGIFALIVRSAFSPIESTGAFVGGSVGAAMLWGMKRALYSSEVGLGNSAIAHSAAKTDEPAREGIVAGLEPFIDTLIVCTITGLVILSAGVWNRGPDSVVPMLPEFEESAPGVWSTDRLSLPVRELGEWAEEMSAFAIILDERGDSTRINGTILMDGELPTIEFESISRPAQPEFRDGGVYQAYTGASLTALAFNQTHDWLGIWLVTIAAWFFAISTIISQGYYAEQALIYLSGGRGMMSFRLLYCAATFVATLGFMKTDRQLDAVTTFGTGLVLLSSLPITLFFGHKAIKAYHEYMHRLKSGSMVPEHVHVHLAEVISGKDVEEEK
jgi:alanine or glycine:cation symporter, AGCS family